MTPKPKLEIQIEVPACEFAEKRGWLQTKFVTTSGRAWPDRIFIRKGRVIFIEFKRPGEEPTPTQYKRHREIRAQGVEVFWTDNLEEAKRILL